MVGRGIARNTWPTDVRELRFVVYELTHQELHSISQLMRRFLALGMHMIQQTFNKSWNQSYLAVPRRVSKVCMKLVVFGQCDPGVDIWPDGGREPKSNSRFNKE
jgi:hypothetical protein